MILSGEVLLSWSLGFMFSLARSLCLPPFFFSLSLSLALCRSSCSAHDMLPRLLRRGEAVARDTEPPKAVSEACLKFRITGLGLRA